MLSADVKRFFEKIFFYGICGPGGYFFSKKSSSGSIPDLNCGVAVLKYWNKDIRKNNSCKWRQK